MNLTKKKAQLVICFLFIIPIGCRGYRLVGTGTGITAGASRISIPVFKNNSPEPGIERNLTAKMREAFIQDGRLHVVREQKADLIFTGNINYYELRPVSFDTNDNVIEYWVIMNIDVKVKDTSEDKYLIDKSFRSKWDYKVSSEVLSSERARLDAIDEASRDFAERMVSIIVDGFKKNN